MHLLMIFVGISLTVGTQASESDGGGNQVHCNATSTTGGAIVDLVCQMPDDMVNLRPVSITIEHHVNNAIKYNVECQLLQDAKFPNCGPDGKIRLREGNVSNSLQVSIEGLANATEGSYVCKAMSLHVNIPDSSCTLRVIKAVQTTTVAPILEEEIEGIASDVDQINKDEEASSQTSNNLPLIIGLCAGASVLIALVVLIIFLVRRKRRAAAGKSKSAGENEESTPFTPSADLENGNKDRLSTDRKDNPEESVKSPTTEDVTEDILPERAEKNKLLDNEEKQFGDEGERASQNDAGQDGGPTRDSEPRPAEAEETTPARHPVPVHSDNSPPPLAEKRSRPPPMSLLSSAGDGEAANDQSHVEQSSDSAEDLSVRAVSPLCKDIKAQQKAFEPKVISSIVSRTRPYDEDDIQNEYRRPPRVSEFGRGPPEDE